MGLNVLLKAKYAVALFLAAVILLPSCFLINASAASDSIVKVLKSGTKSTEYGTITGQIIRLEDDVQQGQGRELRLEATTSVNSSRNMQEVSTEIECVYNDTGTAPGASWSNYSSTRNAKSSSVDVLLFPGPNDTQRDIAIFTAHQIIDTKAYVLNMSIVY